MDGDIHRVALNRSGGTGHTVPFQHIQHRLHAVVQGHGDFRQIPAAFRQLHLTDAHDHGVNGEIAVFINIPVAGSQILAVGIHMVAQPGVIGHKGDLPVPFQPEGDFLQLFLAHLVSGTVLHKFHQIRPRLQLAQVCIGWVVQVNVILEGHLEVNPPELAAHGNFLSVIIAFKQCDARLAARLNGDKGILGRGLACNVQHFVHHLMFALQPVGVILPPQGTLLLGVLQVFPIAAPEVAQNRAGGGIGGDAQRNQQTGGGNENRQTFGMFHGVPFRRPRDAFFHKGGVDSAENLGNIITFHGSRPSFLKYF